MCIRDSSREVSRLSTLLTSGSLQFGALLLEQLLISSEELRIVLQIAGTMNEEVSEGEISVQGIQQLILVEYNLDVYKRQVQSQIFYMVKI